MIKWKDFLLMAGVEQMERNNDVGATLAGPGGIKVRYTPSDAFRVCAHGNLALSSLRVLTKKDREKRILRMVSYDFSK